MYETSDEESGASSGSRRLWTVGQDWTEVGGTTFQQLPLGQIQAAGKALGGYHFRMEYTPGIFYEGDLDVSQNRQHFLIGHAGGRNAPAEVFWEGAEGYGTAQGSARWVRLHGSPLPDLHKSAIDLLHPESIVEACRREEASSWVAEVRPQFLAPRDDTENWVRGTFGEARNDKMRATLQRVTDLARTLEVKTTLVISRGSHLIEQVNVHPSPAMSVPSSV